jgi:hypothetical protein
MTFTKKFAPYLEGKIVNEEPKRILAREIKSKLKQKKMLK